MQKQRHAQEEQEQRWGFANRRERCSVEARRLTGLSIPDGLQRDDATDAM